MNKKLYAGLLILTIAATVAGWLTLVPWPGASYPNVLGYRSLCTFAPAATFFCFGIAGLSCVLRASLVKRKALTGKSELRPGPVAAVVLVFAIAIGFTFWFGVVKAQYPDGGSGASAIRDAG